VNARRILARALVVIGGAAAVSAIAWLTATASASTVTQDADGPIGSVVTTVGDPRPPVLAQVAGAVPVARHADSAATSALAQVRDLSGVAAQTEALGAGASHAVASVPAAVLAVGRVAVAATDLTDFVAPAGKPSDHNENPPAGSDAAGPADSAPAPADSGPRERSAGLSPAATPVHAATARIAGQSHADSRSEHGAGGLPGRSWLPSCVVPANAGLTAGHDHGCGDAVQASAADHPQPVKSRNGVLRRAVTSTEIQPGTTPD
jgi:hypothetical protein